VCVGATRLCGGGGTRPCVWRGATRLRFRYDPYANAFRIDTNYHFSEMQQALGRYAVTFDSVKSIRHMHSNVLAFMTRFDLVQNKVA
jgi:hypothetical protein